MIQMLDPPGVWGLSRRGLHFLLKNRRNKRKDIKKGAFSIARHRNLRGLDLVCINANFSIKNVILKRRMKTVTLILITFVFSQHPSIAALEG